MSTGFMTKIKKLLETVCHNCGKIKVDEVSRSPRTHKLDLTMVANLQWFRAIPNLWTLFATEIRNDVSMRSGGFANPR